MKYFFLLSILLLSSCTNKNIDQVVEAPHRSETVEISENDIHKENVKKIDNLETIENIDGIKNSEVILDAEIDMVNNSDIEKNADTPEIIQIDTVIENEIKPNTVVLTKKNQFIKDLGNGFSIYQSEWETSLYHNDYIYLVYENSLESFDRGQQCDFFNICGSTTDTKNISQELINTLMIDLFSVKVVKGDIALVMKHLYEGAEAFIINITTHNKKKVNYLGTLKLENGKSGNYMLYDNGYGCEGGLDFIGDNLEIVNLFKNNCEDVTAENANYREIKDYELLINKQINVTYIGPNVKEMHKIIHLNDFFK